MTKGTKWNIFICCVVICAVIVLAEADETDHSISSTPTPLITPRSEETFETSPNTRVSNTSTETSYLGQSGSIQSSGSTAEPAVNGTLDIGGAVSTTQASSSSASDYATQITKTSTPDEEKANNEGPRVKGGQNMTTLKSTMLQNEQITQTEEVQDKKTKKAIGNKNDSNMAIKEDLEDKLDSGKTESYRNNEQFRNSTNDIVESTRDPNVASTTSSSNDANKIERKDEKRTEEGQIRTLENGTVTTFESLDNVSIRDVNATLENSAEMEINKESTQTNDTAQKGDTDTAQATSTEENISGKQLKTQQTTSSKPEETTSRNPITKKETTSSNPINSEQTTTSQPPNTEETTTSQSSTEENISGKQLKTQQTTSSKPEETTSRNPITKEETTSSNPINSEQTTTSQPPNTEETTTSQPVNMEETTTIKPVTTTIKPVTTTIKPINLEETTNSIPVTTEESTNSKPGNSDEINNNKPGSDVETTSIKPTTTEETTKIPIADMLMNDQPIQVEKTEETTKISTENAKPNEKPTTTNSKPKTEVKNDEAKPKTETITEEAKPNNTTEPEPEKAKTKDTETVKTTTTKPKKKKSKKIKTTSTTERTETTTESETEPTTYRDLYNSKYLFRDIEESKTTDDNGEMSSSTETTPDTTVPWDHYGMPFGYGPWMDGTFGNPLWSEEEPFLQGPGTRSKELTINGEIKIIKGEEWTPDLEQTDTIAFGVLAAKVKQQLKQLYAKTTISKVLKRIEITGFKPKEGILVTYNLLLQTASDLISRHYLVNVFNKHLKDRIKLGPYTLDPKSTSFDLEHHHKALNLTDSSDEDPAIPQWAIAFIVVAAACLIFSLMFAAVTVYGRSHGTQNNTIYDREGMVESCPGWERKLAAAYENIAADSVYDNEDGTRSPNIRKDSQRRVDRRDSERDARSLGCPEERYQVSDRII